MSSSRLATSARPRSSRRPGGADRRCAIHGWIYGLQDGRLRDLGVSTSDVNGIDATYHAALAALGAGQAVEP